MTVSELIEELKKHPGHYVAKIVTWNDDEMGNPYEAWNAVENVEMESNIDAVGCVVKIVAK